MSMALSSLVTKFSDVLQRGRSATVSASPPLPLRAGRGGDHGGGSGLVTPAGGVGRDNFDDSAVEAALLAAAKAANETEAADLELRSTTQQLAVLDNLLSVSTSNSMWMKQAEKSMQKEGDDYLDLSYEGW